MTNVMNENAFMKATLVMDDLFLKIKFVLTTTEGWVAILFTFITATFGVKSHLFSWIAIALLSDLFFGIWSSLKTKKFKISIAIYSTVVKFIMYLFLFFMPLILEKILSDNAIGGATILVTALLCAAEFFSICAHMLIIKPDLPAVKILHKVLAGEMAHKLGIEVDELEEYFNKTKET